MSIPVLQNPLSGLLQGISKPISAFVDVLQQRKQRQEESTLGNLLSSIGEEGGPKNLQDVIALAAQQKISPDLITKFGTLQATIQKAQPKEPFGTKSPDELSALFQKFGMPKEVANRNSELYGSLSVGGKTAFAQQLMDQMQRGTLGGGLFDVAGDFQENSTDPKSNIANVEPAQDPGFQFPEIDIFQGLTPVEKVKRQSEIFNVNTKEFKENADHLYQYNDTDRSIRQLTKINDSGKLPKGAIKAANVDFKSGKLRIPALANRQTQDYVKLINQFIRGAKDSFGARVTNFELDTFLQQLPTLANTEDGRRIILKQMDIVNKINQLHADSSKEVYNHYGLRDIDTQKTDQLVQQMMEPKLAQLEKDYDNTFYAQEDYLAKEQTPKGQIAIEIKGERGYIDPSEKELAIEKGARIL